MRKTITWGIAIALTLAALLLTVPVGAADSKVTICHIQPGNPGNAHTITVGEAEARSHLRLHRDSLGACRSDARPPDGGDDEIVEDGEVGEDGSEGGGEDAPGGGG